MSGPFGEVARGVNRLYGAGTVSGLSESQLLDRFLARKDEVAFGALVARHGPMVLAVCRRVLRDDHAADDAFQATFLLLVRKAGSIRGADLLGPWLHRVAYRVAVRAGQAEARRLAKETPSPDALANAPAPDRPGREWRLALHEVLDGLPEKYRAPIVLCYLEGRTHDEAARRLRWPIGSVKGRLSRGRAMLKTRLERRGVTASAGAVATILAGEASASVSVPLKEATVQAAISLAAGKAGIAAAGAFSAAAAILAEEAARAMMIKKCGAVAATLAAVLFAVGGAAVMARQDGAKPAEKPQAADGKPEEPKTDLDRLQGHWVRESIESGGQKLKEPAAPSTLEHIAIRDGTLFGTLDDGKLAFPREIRVMTEASPKRFEWRRVAAGGDEEITRGIYKIEGETFTICYDTQDATNAPSDFATSREDGRVTSVYRREPPPAEVSEEAKAELAKLQGRWSLDAWEIHGDGMRRNFINPPERQRKGLVIREDSLTQLDSGEAPSNQFRISLNLAKTPHVMEFRPTPEMVRAMYRDKEIPVTRAIYKLVGDKLIFCQFAEELGGNPNTPPTEFVTRPRDGLLLTVYRRGEAPPAKTKAEALTSAKSKPSEAKTEAAKPREANAKPKAAEPLPGEVVAARLSKEADDQARERDDLAITIELKEDEIANLRSRIQDLERILSASEFSEQTGIVTDRVIADQDEKKRQDRLKRLEATIEGNKRRYRDLKEESLRGKRTLELLAREIADKTEKAAAAKARPGKPGTVQPGDILVVEVLEALPGRPIGGERIVKPDGMISLGFYGEVKVEGLTRGEIKVKVIEHLRKILTDESLGLEGHDPETGKKIVISAADTERVFVDDVPYDSAEKGDPVKALEKKLDDVLSQLAALKRMARPPAQPPK